MHLDQPGTQIIMNEQEFIGTVNRFGTEFEVYLDPAENQLRITDERGMELRCSNKSTKEYREAKKILERIPKILSSLGL